VNLDALVKECINHLQRLSSLDEDSLSLLVGYSGGVDSLVLLHVLSGVVKQNTSLTIRAIHVNHGLSPHADQWQAHCKKICLDLGIPFVAEKVEVAKTKGGLEEAARTVRYAAYRRHLKKTDVLVLAHHQGDQAETVLYRLMRGTGVKGLAGMSVAKGPLFEESDSHVNLNIIRPLLPSSKALIVQYAKDHHLNWVEDESNLDVTFSRNFLRHRIIPELEQHWPHAVNAIARASSHCLEAQQLNGELAQLDLEKCFGDNERLVIDKLLQLSNARQRNLLRYRIDQLSLSMPSEAVLLNVQAELLNAHPEAQPLVSWGNSEARRFQGELYLQLALPPVNAGSAETVEKGLAWDANATIEWQPLKKTIEVQVASQGLSNRYLGKALILNVRQGGERCHPAGRTGGSQKLKKLFQEYGVEPWLRDRWPLLFCDDELIAVPGLFVCDKAVGDANSSVSLELV